MEAGGEARAPETGRRGRTLRLVRAEGGLSARVTAGISDRLTPQQSSLTSARTLGPHCQITTSRGQRRIQNAEFRTLRSIRGQSQQLEESLQQGTRYFP